MKVKNKFWSWNLCDVHQVIGHILLVLRRERETHIFESHQHRNNNSNHELFGTLRKNSS